MIQLDNKPQLIEGTSYTDQRGQINFANNFDMSPIKRVYYTEHFSTKIVRAWQAHIIEKRWFLCVNGCFTIKLVAIDDFENPSDNLRVDEYELLANSLQILYIPNGYANGFQALEDNSKLMIFSDYTFGANENDQLRFDKEKWTTWNH